MDEKIKIIIRKENAVDIKILGKTPIEYVRECADEIIKRFGDAEIAEDGDDCKDGSAVLTLRADMPFVTPNTIINMINSVYEADAAKAYLIYHGGEDKDGGISFLRPGRADYDDAISADAYFNDLEETSRFDNMRLYNMAVKIMQRRINRRLINDRGVVMLEPDEVYIDSAAVIGRGTFIYPGVYIEGNATIGENCVIGPDARLTGMTVGDNVTIQYSVASDSEIGANTTVGPFAYIRPGSKIGAHVKVGDFVEVKNSSVGDGTKISHLTYVGDSDVGKNVNFGCGTVTVNYDGKKKFRTVIGDNVFIGCNTNLISPVKVGDGAYIAAGSTITDEIPENNFSIARARQVNKDNWKDKRK